MMMKLTACALAFSSFAMIAHAGPRDQQTTASLEVFYGDLNLSHPMGADAMMRRLNAAAAKVCGGQPDSRELRERMAFRACLREAVSGAVREVNAPLLTALFGQIREQYAAADTRN